MDFPILVLLKPVVQMTLSLARDIKVASVPIPDTGWSSIFSKSSRVSVDITALPGAGSWGAGSQFVRSSTFVPFFCLFLPYSL